MIILKFLHKLKLIFIEYGTFELRIRSEFYCSNDVEKQ